MFALRSFGALLALLAALGVAGCGSSEEQIPDAEAAALTVELDALQFELDAGLCTDADIRVQLLFDQASELPGGDLKKGLNTLLRELDDRVRDQCELSEETTTTTTDETTTDTETDATTTDTTDTETTTTTETDATTTDTGTGGEPTSPGGGGVTPGGG
jgi:hypothetical protein